MDEPTDPARPAERVELVDGTGLDPIDLSILRGSRTAAITAGVVSLAIGVAVMAWPNHVLHAIAVIAGIGFLLSGAASTFDALVTHRAGSYWGVLLARGIIEMGLGVAVIAYPTESVIIVAILIGLNLIIGGVVQLLLARQVPKGLEDRSHYLWRGALWIVAGVLVIALPGESAAVLAFIVGFFFVLSGVLLLFLGLQLGRAERAVS